MKHVLIIPVLLLSLLSKAQTYDEQIEKAAGALQKKDYCTALRFFQAAFTDTAKISIFDLYYAARAASNCHGETQAIQWLQKAQSGGLGSNAGEAAIIAGDSALLPLHTYPQWQGLIHSMQKAFLAKEEAHHKRSADWLATTTSNAIKPARKDKFNAPKPGFALYFSKYDTLQVPYSVYVPSSYDPSRPARAIVYLHGGVVSTVDFGYSDPDQIKGEPIFEIGDHFNAIIIYPFGKRDFGWVRQRPAFLNILTIIGEVQKRYHIDPQQIYLGGMSNGGTATFWFAAHKPDLFRGFYAISALPRPPIDTLDFPDLSKGKPFYSLHAKDDDVYPYDTVAAIYRQKQPIAPDWHFDTVPAGGHGFIYGEDGKQWMDRLFAKLLVERL